MPPRRDRVPQRQTISGARNTVPGFRASGIHGGIKTGGRRDLALVVSDPPARVAGVFTRNRVQAAPVQIARQRVRSGRCGAVLVNSGNANACTGRQGLQDAGALCRWTAAALGIDEERVLPASTGVIGEPLPTRRIRPALPRLVRALGSGGLPDAAEAICTTDRFPKTGWVQGVVGGRQVTLFGMAKGAGMIRPDMATMLAFFLTDLKAPVSALRRLVREAADASFNRISVDGDMSTNDTVLLLANGIADNRTASPGSPAYEAFSALLVPMMRELAALIVRDGEGATKAVEIRVVGARSRADARRIAYHLAGSPLVKTSFYGQDPNWGRLMAALGTSGADLDPERVQIAYDGVPVVRRGQGTGKPRLAQARRVLRKETFAVTVDLRLGDGTHTVLTSDLTHDYVRLNATYTS